MTRAGEERDQWELSSGEQTGKFEEVRARLVDLISEETKRVDDVIIDPPAERPFIHITTEDDDLQVEIIARPRGAQGHLSLNEWRDIKSVSQKDVLQFLESIDAPAVTTNEVASHFDVPHQIASKYLNQLYERGRVKRRKSGQTMTWWETDEQDLLRGFGAFSDTEIPELMREERERARKEWEDDDSRNPLS